MMYKLQHKVKIEWSPNFAYAIGLIATDGFICTNGRHIGLKSKDFELVAHFKRALNITNEICRNPKLKNKEKKYFHITVGDKIFCEFLNSIGITQRKSKTIKFVKVPEEYFSDFLRGVFDGDETFYTFWDKRWPKSFGFQISFASASLEFVQWLQKRLKELYNVGGFIRRGDGVFNLRYVKGDTQRLFLAMYPSTNLLYLKRKREKMQKAFTLDQTLHPSRIAAVAQW